MASFWSTVETLQRKLEPLLNFLRNREDVVQEEDQLDQETFSCSICLEVLKDPVAIPCGHSYCMKCINDFWDEEEENKIPSCPQCRRMFIPRPELVKNTMLAALVEQLKKNGLQAAPADHCYAGPEDVVCDFCSGKQLKAIKSCLFCLASYCENHLQPHHDVAPLKKHKLVDPSKNLQDNVCPCHGEVMKMFCRTDQKCICYLCSLDEHKGHDTVSAAAERTERQREMEVSRQQVQQKIQDREKDVRLLQQEVEAINQSADKTVEDSEEIFAELISLIQKRSSNVKQQIRSQQETEVSRVRELVEKLQQEITDLKRRDAEMKQLSDTEDHNEFIRNSTSATYLSKSIYFPISHSFYLQHFRRLKSAASLLRDKVQEILKEEWMKISLVVPEVDVSHSKEPKTRADFLEWSQEITLDPNTAHMNLSLSEGNSKVTYAMGGQHQSYHPDRCVANYQVLSRESLTGRCYWEVEKGVGGIAVVLEYKDSKTVKERFGENAHSWALCVSKRGYKFKHNRTSNRILSHFKPMSSRIGVYLDHRAGVLSFYSVSETMMTLLHTVQTTFTQPLYAGVALGAPIGNTAEFCRLEPAGKGLKRSMKDG
ncbi:tripartite motif-containing protein 16-like [Cololabis saira]|uniref:tripartite motif-containing protein 16-like n=1 Tax=Cololabis saira TaxID=129043 RepID=UPI002AD4B409|nr:tripartite motif-containing protein 16-like [Cololabis saira]